MEHHGIGNRKERVLTENRNQSWLYSVGTSVSLVSDLCLFSYDLIVYEDQYKCPTLLASE